MGNTAALTSRLIDLKTSISYYTQKEIFWSGKNEANTAKLEKQTRYYEKWLDAFDDAIDNTKDLTFGTLTVRAGNQNEDLADAYADLKVKQYNEELSLELAELDMDYDATLTMIEALLEEMRAQKDSTQTAVQNTAQDSGVLQG